MKGTKNYGLSEVYFEDKNGNELAKIFGSKSVIGQSSYNLNEGEEIIGVYGNKDGHTNFLSLGFIVWKPDSS